ncbi:response regulator transcription factor [Bifidobacterium oedipodis]|uniref:Transcriptional regulator n=1 Tax=Bifidobacterium oedipodis TaxID=2675322 RepID=A0A7Y0HTV7_9BIFI|nr:response regulator transcription factor [Bifidobacterium sp. DSM 109957]NMM94472.1 transcriptional regulator [Bifidobacterium sp. DSM 109957]
MKILVVEDEESIREGIGEFLRSQGYEVKEAADGLEGLDVFREFQPDLMILDIMMPKMNGLAMLKEIRKTSRLPVLMLTAMSDEKTQVASFDALADDYISKPFSLLILKKRVEALLRRSGRSESVWTCGEAKVDFDGFQAWYQEEEADLKPKEIRLLKYLVDHTGQVLTRQQMLDQLWDMEEAPFDRVIDVYIKNLRKKLHLECITTVKGVGYKIQ